MFTYRIKHPNSARSDGITDKGVILRNALARCPFIIGDAVRFRVRNGAKGRIVDIESHMDKITWTHGGLCPANIVLDVEDPQGNIRRVKTNYKKLVAIK